MLPKGWSGHRATLGWYVSRALNTPSAMTRHFTRVLARWPLLDTEVTEHNPKKNISIKKKTNLVLSHGPKLTMLQHKPLEVLAVISHKNS